MNIYREWARKGPNQDRAVGDFFKSWFDGLEAKHPVPWAPSEPPEATPTKQEQQQQQRKEGE